MTQHMSKRFCQSQLGNFQSECGDEIMDKVRTQLVTTSSHFIQMSGTTKGLNLMHNMQNVQFSQTQSYVVIGLFS